MITINEAIIGNKYILFNPESENQDIKIYTLDKIAGDEPKKHVVLFYDVISHLDAHSATNMTFTKAIALREFLTLAKTYNLTT